MLARRLALGDFHRHRRDIAPPVGQQKGQAERRRCKTSPWLFNDCART